MSSNAMIDRLEAERTETEDFMEKVVAGAQEQKRDLSDTENETLSNSRKRIAEIDKQLEPLRDFAKAREAHRQGGNIRPAGGAGGNQDPTGLGAQTQARGHQYRSAGEILADSWRAKNHQDDEATKRLESIGRGMVNGKLEVTDRATARAIDDQHYASLSAEARAAAPHVTTVEIPGVLPNAIVGPIVSNVDSARPFITSIGGAKDMAGIPGKTFSRPYVSEHVQVANQAAEKTAVQAGQLKILDVDFTKSTEGGYVNVSRQSIDWSSPTMWNVLLEDFQKIYARHTENKAADAWFTAVQTGVAVDTVAATGVIPTLNELITALYSGAVACYTLTQRMPDTVWMSLDRWGLVSTLIDQARAGAAGSNLTPGSPGTLATNSLLDLPRVVVPQLAAATLVIGVSDMTEAYEERLGFLSAVQPSLLGVELAYGGYFASGTLDVNAFVELTFS